MYPLFWSKNALFVPVFAKIFSRTAVRPYVNIHKNAYFFALK